MHDGAYPTLEAAVRHYLDPSMALRSYDASQLRDDLRGSVVTDPASLDAMAATLDPSVQSPLTLSDADIADIVAFLRSLTDAGARSLGNTIPSTVPSGLPVGD
jgi:cytochrome c peroxidase